jgi:hypothetical protein
MKDGGYDLPPMDFLRFGPNVDEALSDRNINVNINVQSAIETTNRIMVNL